MCKVTLDVDTDNILALAQDLEAREDIKSVAFKYNSKPNKFFK